MPLPQGGVTLLERGIELPAGAFVHLSLRRIGFLLKSAVTGSRGQHHRAGRGAVDEKSVPICGYPAAFNIRLQHSGIVHAFTRHIGKYDRILAAGMTGPGNMPCGLAGQQETIAGHGLDRFHQRAVHP